MDTKQKKEEGNSDGVIRVFRALVVVIFSVLLGYFVYTSSTHPDSQYPFKLGLDLAGGSHLVYEADVSSLNPSEVPELMSILRSVIERRVNSFGVSEPVVQVEESSAVAGEKKQRLIIELPGVTDIDEAIKQIGQTPLLEFKLLDPQALAAQEAVDELAASNTNIGISNVKMNGEEINPYKDTGLTGRYFKRAEPMLPQANQGGGFSSTAYLNITFNDEGAELFAEITRNNVGKQLAIFLDGEMLSAPTINEPILGGNAVITGSFTGDEVKALARNLNFGALPMPINLVSTQSIGASLGERAIDAGVYSGVLGLGVIALFMIVWYRLPGLVAALSLLTYVLMMLAIFKLIPVTLTAAGLAGLVLSIGLAVDANILISERLKEELRRGKGAREAIEEGFSQAWSSIRDGNLVNVISGVILYWFGDVFIEGFAFTLIIGTIVSLLSSLLISRTFLLAMNMRGDRGLGRFLMGSGIHK